MKWFYVLVCLVLLPLAYSCAQTNADPIAVWGKLVNLVITKGKAYYNTNCAAILADPTLHIENVKEWVIFSYIVSIVPDRGDYIGPYSQNSQKLSKEVQDIIEKQQGKKGKILIEEIRGYNPNCRGRALGGMTLNYSS